MWWNSSWAIPNPGRWCYESVTLNMPANLENWAVATALEKVSFHSNPKERQCQKMLKLLAQLHSSHMLVKTTEDEMVGWHYWLNIHGFECIPGVGDGQGGLGCCGSWGRKESDMTEQLNWTELTPYTKLNSKWVKDLNVRPEKVKTLRGKHRQNTGWHKSKQDPLWPTSYSNRNKNKSKQWDLIKLKRFWTAEETISKVKRQPSEWEKRIASEITDKGLICKIYRQLIQVNVRKTNNPIQKWDKDINRHFSKEDLQMANKHEKMLNSTYY